MLVVFGSFDCFGWSVRFGSFQLFSVSQLFSVAFGHFWSLVVSWLFSVIFGCLGQSVVFSRFWTVGRFQLFFDNFWLVGCFWSFLFDQSFLVNFSRF